MRYVNNQPLKPATSAAVRRAEFTALMEARYGAAGLQKALTPTIFPGERGGDSDLRNPFDWAGLGLNRGR